MPSTTRGSEGLPFKPKRYQKRAIKFMIERGAAALFLDPGLGKTAITYAAFEVLRAEGLVRTALVVAPLRVAHSVWPAEARKWKDFHHLRVSVLHGKGKDERLRERADVYVVNPEGLEWLFRSVSRSKRFPFDVLVIDESTKFKNTRTQRFKTLKPYLGRFKRRYILTGTPAPNGLIDLFGQVFVLDGGRALGQFITHYRLEHFYQTGYGGYEWRLKPGHDEQIYAKLRPLALRMSSRDHLDLPPLTVHDVWIDLPPKARRAYDEMERELIAQLDSGEVVAANAAAASTKCRQIAGGAVYLDDHRWYEVHAAKLEAALDLLDELGGKPTLVLYEYDHERQRLVDKRKAPWLAGGVTPKRALELERAWNAGDLPVLLAHPQSVAHGLNLQRARGSSLVWFTTTWDLELYEQAWQRLLRQGREDPLRVYRVLARDTVEEAVVGALAGKARTQGALLRALQAYRRGVQRG